MSASKLTLDADFFASLDNTQLFGVWRAPDHEARAVCVVAPPFAEEEKSSRRVLTTLLQAWRAQGIASFLPTLRGTGDAEGDFSSATLQAWRDDLRAACAEAQRRAPNIPLWLLGARLGGALAMQIAPDVNAQKLYLLEPVLDGKRYLSQLEAKHRLRASLTQHEGGEASNQKSQTSTLDLDGWPLSEELRAELRALNVAATPAFKGESVVVGIGPRAELSPALRAFADTRGASGHAVVMPAFWNANDELDATPLLEVLCGESKARLAPTSNQDRAMSRLEVSARLALTAGERSIIFHNARNQALVGVYHGLPTAPRDLAVVLLHGWSGYRVGPHQMLTRAARAFAADGFPTLRFDFAGRGDSDGETSHATLATMREDTRAALQALRATGTKRFALIGLCAGCEIAFACADEDGVAALGLWSAPVFAAGESSTRASKRRAHFLKVYAGKLLRPETWRKVLKGGVDARGVGKVLGGQNKGEARNAEANLPGQLPPGWKSERLIAFARAAPQLHPPLLIYGTNDPTAPEAEAWYRERCENAKISPVVHHVAGANHSYYGLNWEAEVIAQTRAWLKK